VAFTIAAESSDGQAMKEGDIKQLVERCRSLARNADTFTKKRLLDLALRYEAMCEKQRGTPKVVSLSMKVISRPITVQSITIQEGDRSDHLHGNGDKTN
jgi:hypothetical protein